MLVWLSVIKTVAQEIYFAALLTLNSVLPAYDSFSRIFWLYQVHFILYIKHLLFWM